MNFGFLLFKFVLENAQNTLFFSFFDRIVFPFVLRVFQNLRKKKKKSKNQRDSLPIKQAKE